MAEVHLENNSSDAGKGDDRILSTLREMLASGVVLPPERTLAEELSVSRHQLRRALKVLRDAGDLPPAKTGRRSSGAAPRSASRIAHATNPLEMLEMRMMIEPKLARLAALRASPAEIDKIIAAATTPVTMHPSEADQVFHHAVADGARNSLATELHVLMLKVQRDSRMRYTDSDSDAEVTRNRVRARDAEHVRIAQAIAERDPEKAERAMYMHLAQIQSKLQQQLGLGVPVGMG